MSKRKHKSGLLGKAPAKPADAAAGGGQRNGAVTKSPRPGSPHALAAQNGTGAKPFKQPARNGGAPGAAGKNIPVQAHAARSGAATSARKVPKVGGAHGEKVLHGKKVPHGGLNGAVDRVTGKKRGTLFSAAPVSQPRTAVSHTRESASRQRGAQGSQPHAQRAGAPIGGAQLATAGSIGAAAERAESAAPSQQAPLQRRTSAAVPGQTPGHPHSSAEAGVRKHKRGVSLDDAAGAGADSAGGTGERRKKRRKAKPQDLSVRAAPAILAAVSRGRGLRGCGRGG